MRVLLIVLMLSTVTAVAATAATSDTSLADRLADVGPVMGALLLLVFGLFLAFTPCIYPIMSITVAYFAGQVGDSRGKVIARASLYVLGLALTYSAMGTVAALTGSLFGAALQSKAVIAGLALILIALALSMFGLYEMRPPGFLANKQTARSGLLGALVMGLIFGLIAGPCTGPVVAGLLAYVAKLGNPVTGFLSFLILGLGMGIPLFVLAAFSGRMPVPGAWMVTVKMAAGFLLLAVAAHTLAPILPVVGPYLLPAVLAAAAIWFAFFEKNLPQGSVARMVVVMLCVVALGVATLSVTGTLREQKMASLPEAQSQSVIMEELAEGSVQKSIDAGRPVLMYFGADWCPSCQEMKKGALKHPGVIAESQRFDRYHVDETDPNEFQQSAASSRGISGIPVVILYNSSGEEVDRIIGNVPPEELLERMKGVK